LCVDFASARDLEKKTRKEGEKKRIGKRGKRKTKQRNPPKKKNTKLQSERMGNSRSVIDEGRRRGKRVESKKFTEGMRKNQ